MMRDSIVVTGLSVSTGEDGAREARPVIEITTMVRF